MKETQNKSNQLAIGYVANTNVVEAYKERMKKKMKQLIKYDTYIHTYIRMFVLILTHTKCY